MKTNNIEKAGLLKAPKRKSGLHARRRRVRARTKPARDAAWDEIGKLAGTGEGPEDWATEHDHYIHGSAKKGYPLSLEDDLLVLAKAVPPSEWAKLPNDLNENLDHYLYGSPKKHP